MLPQQPKRSLSYYSSRTGTRRNLEALRRHGCGLLVSRAGVWRTEGFEDWVGDNGAWADYQAGRGFDEDAYEKFLDWVGGQKTAPAWLVLPDIVAGGARSLDLSMRYMNRCRSLVEMVLVAVQDGMSEADLAPFVGPQVGVFLGGSTEWKIAQMRRWGDFCERHGAHYHVARVNSIKRMSLAVWAKAHSADGSSASRYAVSLPKLVYASRQMDLGIDG